MSSFYGNVFFTLECQPLIAALLKYNESKEIDSRGCWHTNIDSTLTILLRFCEDSQFHTSCFDLLFDSGFDYSFIVNGATIARMTNIRTKIWDMNLQNILCLLIVDVRSFLFQHANWLGNKATLEKSRKKTLQWYLIEPLIIE